MPVKVEPADLRALKGYMHVDHDDDDGLIQRLWAASTARLGKNGIDVTSDDGWLAAAGMTLQAYDGTPLPPGIAQLINGLKLDHPLF